MGDPRQIGPFRMVGLLGGGGMGRVYLGRGADGRTVAVKTARAELADDRGFRKRFAREVAAARQVGGAFVAPVVDAAPHDEIPWMATEYVPGVSLSDAVHDTGPLPVPTVRALTAGLLQALAAVHAQGLVHRDLKPSNILLTADGPRVIDFGIAHSATDTALTATGAALGTPGFMAPEQLTLSGGEITGAADVFALGGVLVHAATGSGPYGSAEPQILMYRTVHEQPRLDGLPESLRALASACLVKEPERRPAVADLAARVGAPGPYGNWLPEPVTAQLRSLSDRLRDPRRPGPDGTDRTPNPLAPGAATPPAAPWGAAAPPHALPTAPAAVPAAAPTPPQGRYGPAPVMPPPGETGDTGQTGETAPGGRPGGGGRTRRGALAGLSAVGVGALTWFLWPAGEAGRDPSVGATPPGRKPSSGRSPRAGLPAGIRDRGRLVVGSDLSYAPMGFVKEGRPAGLDIELARALGRDLGIEVKISNGSFGALLPGLASGRYDLVISALADTEDRQRGPHAAPSGVDLVDYLRSGFALVVPRAARATVKGLDDLTGKVVAVQQGSAAREHLAGLGPRKPKVRTFATAEEAYTDVLKGGSDACLDEYPAAVRALVVHTALVTTGGQIAPRPLGIAVAKSQPDLRDAVRVSLDRLIEDGTYGKILGKWDMTECAVERAEINGGS
ncbi:protein kinase domain-containing protein [Streptomyces catenulae]|uniref:Transporter substrate-binding domain-containing protein n=2 Tax=Streptomyces catenulae TaxID=66875 RepID=A0ABV2Z6P6_9ACTN